LPSKSVRFARRRRKILRTAIDKKSNRERKNTR
jgi:hypothetical protein